MKKLSILIATAILLTIPSLATADEGMWMVNLLEKGLITKMKKAGLKLPANVIYDENAVSLSDAVVSLDFGCTGSMISDNGLLITNHHCAYADVHSISTMEHNYLEDGFWAMNASEEVHIPGKGIYFLRKVVDVTDDVIKTKEEYKSQGKPIGSRKLYFVMEKKYSQDTEYEVSMASMWRGNKYYMFFYEVYKDVRLVAAPPVSIAAYGGDVDNWEWPQHKGDFAMYRIYTSPDGKPAEYSKDNVPMHPRRTIKVSTEGVKKGDFTMIMGYPGRTNRYNSSFGVNRMETLTNPINTSLRNKKLDIMNSWMEKEPEIRLKYADKYFSYTNVNELQEGEIMTFRRYGVVDIKKQEEKELQKWIDADSQRKEQWGDLLNQMAHLYKTTDSIERDIIHFRECISSCSAYYILTSRVRNNLVNFKPKREVVPPETVLSQENIQKFLSDIETIYNTIDTRVENELFEFGLRTFYNEVGKEMWGENMTALYNEYNGDISAMVNYLINNSFYTSLEKAKAFVSEPRTVGEITADPLFKLYNGVGLLPFNQHKSKIQDKFCKGNDAGSLEARYTDAVYHFRQDKGMVQYPDANSTMRLTYGNVGPINPSDGIYYSEYSTYEGILQKYNPNDYEFSLKERQKSLLEGKNFGRWADKKTGKLHINFLSNQDITGGNSGSPIMNAKGELVGLAFDGNKEGLCGDAYFHPEYCKTVSVDIRYVLWILDKYAGMNYILKEIGVE